MENKYAELKAQLRNMFQLDQAELDFGIYRIMNQRREAVERFLEHDLLPQVREAFAQFRTEDTATLEADLKRAIKAASDAGLKLCGVRLARLLLGAEDKR